MLDREHYMGIIGDMSPSELIMIGKSTSRKLENLGIRTIRALAAADRSMLRDHFGIVADKMSDAARGVETEEVRLYYDKRTPKSVSHGTTTPRDMTTEEDFRIVVYALAELVAMRLRRYGLSAEGGRAHRARGGDAPSQVRAMHPALAHVERVGHRRGAPSRCFPNSTPSRSRCAPCPSPQRGSPTAA